MLTATQSKFALARAARIRDERIKAIRAEFKAKVVTLNAAQVADALRSGAFKVIDRDYSDQTTYYLSTFVVFPQETALDVVAQDAAIAKVTSAYAKLEEELILGDNEAALAVLRAFEQENA